MTVFDDLGMLQKQFIGRFSGFCKLLSIGHHLKNCLSLVFNLQECFYDVFWLVLDVGLVVKYQ